MGTKDEIHEAFWNGRFVSDAALSTLMRSARRALGDTGRDQRYIRTEYGRGFRFVAEVREGAASAPNALPALAVLPFANLSGDPGNDLIAEGLTQEITTTLGRARNLMIISFGSATSMRARARDPREAGAILGAGYVLDGSINRDGDRVRVNVQLSDASSGVQIWSDRADYRFQSMFDLIDDITARVVGSLRPELLISEIRRTEAVPVRNRSVWQLFVEAHTLVLAPDEASNRRARALLQRPEELEPGVPRVIAGLAFTHVWDLSFGWSADAATSLSLAKEAVANVLARDPGNSWAWSAQGACTLIKRDFDGSIAAFGRARETDPFSAIAWGGAAMTFAYAGRSQEAIAAADHANRLSPLDPRRVVWLNARALALFAEGRFAEAQADAREIVRLRPDYPSGPRLLAAASAALDDIETAARAAERLRVLLPGQPVEEAVARLPFRDAGAATAYVEALRAAGLT